MTPLILLALACVLAVGCISRAAREKRKPEREAGRFNGRTSRRRARLVFARASSSNNSASGSKDRARITARNLPLFAYRRVVVSHGDHDGRRRSFSFF